MLVFLSLCSAQLTLEQLPGELWPDRTDSLGQVHVGCDIQIIFHLVLPHSADLFATEGQNYNCL